MTLTDKLKILDDKIKVNQAQYDLGREVAKISALSSKDLLEKYEYLTGEDLGHRPSVLEKTKFEYSPLGMSLSKSFKKDNVKNIANRESDFNYDSKHSFYRFYKEYNEFEEMSLDSKYNKMKKFINLTIFKNLKQKNPKTQLKKERIMKNVDELYEKYYNAYKNDYDNDDDLLKEGKKKKLDYKQFELFDKTEKKSKLDEEIKKCFKEIQNREKIVDKKKFGEYFSYKSTALVNNLLSRDTQGFKKSLNEIKQQKIKLNEDERNSGNNKFENDEDNNILSVINRIDQFFEYKFLSDEQPDESNIPKWVKVSKQRFDVIKKKVQNAKINNLQTRQKGSKVININESDKLLHEIENNQINNEEPLKRIENIRNDINKVISTQSINLNQVNVLNTFFMVNEIFTGESESVEVNKEDNLEVFKEKSDKEKQESDEQLDTRDMPELESE